MKILLFLRSFHFVYLIIAGVSAGDKHFKSKSCLIYFIVLNTTISCNIFIIGILKKNPTKLPLYITLFIAKITNEYYTILPYTLSTCTSLYTADNLYLDPNFTNVHSHTDTDDSGYSANAGQGENEQSPRMQMHRHHNQIIHDNIAYHANN